MDKVKLISDTKELIFARTRKLSVGQEVLDKTFVVASGRVVKDLIGYRTILTVEWDAPPAKMSELISMISANPFILVEYPDPQNGDSAEIFEISMPEPRIFVYKKGVPMWRDVQLEMRGQVVRDA